MKDPLNTTANVELFSGCLRVFAPGKSYGDDYVFSCSLHWIARDEVEIKGISNPAESPIKYRRAICAELLKYGVKGLRWTRKTEGGEGGERVIRVDISTGKTVKKHSEDLASMPPTKQKGQQQCQSS